jgi:hypothetical protein
VEKRQDAQDRILEEQKAADDKKLEELNPKRKKKEFAKP